MPKTPQGNARSTKIDLKNLAKAVDACVLCGVLTIDLDAHFLDRHVPPDPEG